MSVWAGASDDRKWLTVIAKIDICKPSWTAIEDVPGSEYVVRFSYEVNGKVYRDSYKAGSIQEEGKEFEILYDPANPKNNTGADRILNPWLRWGAAVLGIGLALVAIWLWGDQDWFHQ